MFIAATVVTASVWSSAVTECGSMAGVNLPRPARWARWATDGPFLASLRFGSP